MILVKMIDMLKEEDHIHKRGSLLISVRFNVDGQS